MRQLVSLPFVFLALCLSAPSSPAMAGEALTHDVYTEWNRITEQAIARDGNWALWAMSPEEADGELVIRETTGEAVIRVPRGHDAGFSHDSRHAVLRVAPPHEALRQARLEEVDELERPMDELVLVDLAEGEQTRWERVQSWRLPEESGDWLAWRHEPANPAAEEAEQEGVEDASSGEDEEAASRPDGLDVGTRMVVRSLVDGESFEFGEVGDYAFSANGELLVYTRVSEDGGTDGIHVFDTETRESRPLMQASGHYPAMAIDETGEQVAFLFQARPFPEQEDDEEAATDWDKVPEYALWYWQRDDSEPRRIADESARFLADGWHVSRHGALRFSDSGQRLYFGTAPAPVEQPEHEDKLDEEVVDVDVWHWQDDLLQPMQRERLEQERKRTYLAVAQLDDGERLVQLGREAIPEVDPGEDGDVAMALGLSDRPYRREMSWDYPRYRDAWLIDVDSGEARLVLKAVQDRPSLSPGGAYLHWWDRDAETWLVMATATGESRDVGREIPHTLADHRNDRPFAANAYGSGGWLEDDAGLLIYDRHDVWRVDPTGQVGPRNLTRGLGRERGWRFRVLDLDPEEAALPADEALMLSAFDEASKAHGYFHVSADGGEAPVERVMSAHHYGNPLKAEAADRLLFTRESFQDFPDLWTADSELSDMRRLSDANPQQADYSWGSVEQVEWQAEDGRDHQGLLYRPEGFDPERAYPMIIYFYERASEGLHRHRPPLAHRSVIIPSFYTSNDYVVFVPDVWYREGYPGDSAMESIMPMARSLAAEPWVNRDRIGLQGHSWAGYQIAYMVAQTDFFRAAAGGAPVANMTSAYGGIRWGSGMSRMFQYERTQSRIGQTLWEAPELYLHNSPLFRADHINTPLLMMHNDQDGAVPWEQGIELFTALRRLERPAWLINYRDEPHWPTRFANRVDWQKRLQQFFDHYLKDEPAPRWLRSGIPALEKGATLGYEND